MVCYADMLEHPYAVASLHAAAQLEAFVADPFATVAVAEVGVVAAVAAADAAAAVVAAHVAAAAAADVDGSVGDCTDGGKLDLVEHATAVPTTVKSVVLLPEVQFGQRTCSACGEPFATLKAISGVKRDSLLICNHCR